MIFNKRMDNEVNGSLIAITFQENNDTIQKHDHIARIYINLIGLCWNK